MPEKLYKTLEEFLDEQRKNKVILKVSPTNYKRHVLKHTEPIVIRPRGTLPPISISKDLNFRGTSSDTLKQVLKVLRDLADEDKLRNVNKIELGPIDSNSRFFGVQGRWAPAEVLDDTTGLPTPGKVGKRTIQIDPDYAIPNPKNVSKHETIHSQMESNRSVAAELLQKKYRPVVQRFDWQASEALKKRGLWGPWQRTHEVPRALIQAVQRVPARVFAYAKNKIGTQNAIRLLDLGLNQFKGVQAPLGAMGVSQDLEELNDFKRKAFSNYDTVRMDNPEVGSPKQITDYLTANPDVEIQLQKLYKGYTDKRDLESARANPLAVGINALLPKPTWQLEEEEKERRRILTEKILRHTPTKG